MKSYTLKLTYTDGRTEIIQVYTANLEWAVSQCQRNRPFFTWEIIEENAN